MEQKPVKNYGNLLRLQIPSHPRYIRQVRNFIFQIARDEGFSYQDSADIKLMVGETLHYIMQYACNEKYDMPVFIEISLFPEKLEIRIRDYGKKLDEKFLTGFDLSDYRSDGLGFYIIKKIADHFFLETTNEIGNQFILMKAKSTDV